MPDCSDSAADGHASIGKVLSSKSKQEGDDQTSVITNMDVILDTCWAVMTEIEQLKGQPHLQAFRDKRNDEPEIRGIRSVNGRWEVIEKIGKGAYGNVYLVKSRVDGRYRAMKTVSKAQVFRRPENACFMEERMIMSLPSRWLSRLVEGFQDDLFLYMVMEYFPGGDLTSLDPEQEGIPEDQARFYAAEVLLALEELHGLGWAHRDVKPGNVMLREDGHVRLTDFGSVGRVGPDRQIFSRSSVGTPDYISPEALRAQESKSGASYGPECDWWGLGILLYELLTGEPPFFAPSLVQTYQNISNHQKVLKGLLERAKISLEAKDLIAGLLCDAKERLKPAEIKAHPFFRGIDWESIHEATPPFIPLLESPEDTSRFYLDDDDDDSDGIDDMTMDKRTRFEGVQFPFVGFTFDPARQYLVSHESESGLQRIEASRLRMSELDLQVEEMRQSCEMAKLVGQQIKRIASSEDLGDATGTNPDDLQAAYEALLQNYEFIQTHYEELVGEHSQSTVQLQALMLTLQEQEEAKRSVEHELEEAKKRSAMDKLKISELVSKIAQIGVLPAAAQSTPTMGKEKKLLKEKIQEFKALEQELAKETRARMRLEQELTELKAAKSILEQEHEILLLELRAATPTKLDRKDSSPSLFRAFRHSRQASGVSYSGLNQVAEGPVKILDQHETRRKKLCWHKTMLYIRETGLWIGSSEQSMSLVASFKAEIFWAQPVQPDELAYLPSKTVACCFKLRFITVLDSTDVGARVLGSKEEIEAELSGLRLKLEKERKILGGAQQLMDAARTAEQETLARSHVEASKRAIQDIEALSAALQTKLTLSDDTESILTVGSFQEHGGHCFAPCGSDSAICDACFKPGSCLMCPTCQSNAHRECQGIIPLRCQDAARLKMIVPLYFQTGSAEEARRWMRSLEAARREHRT